MSDMYLQSSDEMTTELQEAWQAMVQGFVKIHHAAVDVKASKQQLELASGLMRYSRMLVASILAYVVQYKQVRRSTKVPPELEVQLDIQLEEPLNRLDGPAIRPDGVEEELPFSGKRVVEEQAFLRKIVTTLGVELSREIQEKSELMTSRQAALNDIAQRAREESEVLRSLRERASSFGVPPKGDLYDDEQKWSDLAHTNVLLKEGQDRLTADVLKLSSDKYTLMSERSALLHRIGELEGQVSDLNATNARYRRLARPPKLSALIATSREIAQKHGTNYKQVSPAAYEASSSKQPKRTLTVGGMEMEPEVVEWLKEMYVTLGASPGPEPAEDAVLRQSPAEKSEFSEFVTSKRGGEPEGDAGSEAEAEVEKEGSDKEAT
ncbi:hypothetical protein DIPPA_15598 [Diplonema papillatum]|nr:hypothetical protein DIPPA_15598 [Diplonema papillatum]|eukprot:gene8936-13836_t